MANGQMNQIEIPVDHFFRAAPRSYNDWMSAVIREFHQNSTDAGATKITYFFDKPSLTLTVTDNGQGCTADDIKFKLLTLGGSGKTGQGTTGGFGVAKEILYFPWTEWSIRTRDVLVTGVGSKYHDPICVRGAAFEGFQAKIKFPSEDAYNRMFWKAAPYLRKCELEGVEVFVNEEQITSTLLKGRLARQFQWADIYVSNVEGQTDCYAHVRVNGVHMFSTWIGDGCPQVIVEITTSSIEVLTSNRDGFRSEEGKTDYQEEFQKFVAELTIDKKQAVRDTVEHTEVIRGEGSIKVEDPYLQAEDPKKSAETVADKAGVKLVEALLDASEEASGIWDKYDVKRCVERTRDGIADAKRAMDIEEEKSGSDGEKALTVKTWVEQQTKIVEVFLKKAEEVAEKGEPETAADILRLMGRFPDVVVKWRGEDKRAVQKVLNLKSVHIVLKAWAEFLKLIMLYAENYGEFKVGVGINLDGVEALYFREFGVHHFLIDPTINESGEKGKFKISSRFTVDEILDRAIHEVAHVRCRHHDVDFSSEQDRIRRALRPHMTRFQEIFTSIRKTTPKVSERD